MQNNNTLSPDRFISARDSVYGLLALCIFLHHSRSFYQIDYTFNIKSIEFVNGIVMYLQIAVEAFFVLSGMSLYRSWKRNKDYGTFVKRRMKRLIPCVFLSYGIFWSVQYIFYRWMPSWLLLKFSLLSTLLVGNNDGSWFITAIVLCYAIYPLLCEWLCPRGEVSLARGVVLFAYYLLVTVLIEKFAPEWFLSQFIMLGRIPSFIAGVILGCKLNETGIGLNLRTRYLYMCSIVVSIIFDVLIGFNVNPFWPLGVLLHTVASIGIVLLLIEAVSRIPNLNFIRRLLNASGQISLELYCWQMILIIVLYHIFGGHILNGRQFIVLTIVSAAISYGTHRLEAYSCNLAIRSIKNVVYRIKHSAN